MVGVSLPTTGPITASAAEAADQAAPSDCVLVATSWIARMVSSARRARLRRTAPCVVVPRSAHSSMAVQYSDSKPRAHQPCSRVSSDEPTIAGPRWGGPSGRHQNSTATSSTGGRDHYRQTPAVSDEQLQREPSRMSPFRVHVGHRDDCELEGSGPKSSDLRTGRVGIV